MLLKKPHFDVLVIGSPCVDMVFSGMPHWPISGQEMYVDSFAISVGAIFNTAATLTRLGMRVGLLCEVGNDFFSRYILEEIDKAGICRDLVLVRDYPVRAVSVCIAHDGERGFVSYADTHAGMVKHMLEILNSDNHPDGARDAQLLAQSLITPPIYWPMSRPPISIVKPPSRFSMYSAPYTKPAQPYSW